MRIPWKVLSITLAAMLIAGSVAAQETPAPQPLTPVQRRAVQAFAADGILEGTSCSVEDCSGTVLRWEVAMWIIRLFNYEPTPHESFADVDSEQRYASFVETLYDQNITVGCLTDPLRFCPERPTSRGQMAAFATRAFNLDDTDPPHRFFDVSPTDVFRDNITALQNAGILSADCDEGERLFCPGQPIVAAEAVEWLYRASLLAPTAGRDNGGGGGGGGGGNFRGGGGGGGGSSSTTSSSTTSSSTTSSSTTSSSTTSSSTTSSSTTSPTTVPVVLRDLEIDVGLNGECTHHDPHDDPVTPPSGDKKSYLILDHSFYDEQGAPQIFRTYYGHWHDDDGENWVYWIPEDARDANGDLFRFRQVHLPHPDDDPYGLIPCHHTECPDHDHSGTVDPEFLAGEHYFEHELINRPGRVNKYTHTHEGPAIVWKFGHRPDAQAALVPVAFGPCDDHVH